MTRERKRLGPQKHAYNNPVTSSNSEINRVTAASNAHKIIDFVGEYVTETSSLPGQTAYRFVQ